MCVQRTRTQQLHAPSTTTLGHPKSTPCNFNSCSFNYKSDYSMYMYIDTRNINNKYTFSLNLKKYKDHA